MHTAQVTTWGQPPQYLPANPPPPPAANEVQIKVTATGLHRIVRSRAAGSHYSKPGTLPHTPGIDGVGMTNEGRLVYFLTFTTGGSYSGIINVPKSAVWPLPDGVDALQVAAMVNPVLSSWMALRARAAGLKVGFTVVIVGVTSASGSVAVDVARAVGAGRVIGVARNEEKMVALELDQRIILRSPATDTDFSLLGDVDVVLDYVYGPPAVHLLQSLKSSRPVQYVHIGSLDSPDISLPGSVLRGKDVTIRGSGIGSWGLAQVGAEIPEILEALRLVRYHQVRAVPLSDVDSVWNEGGDRVVFVP